MTETEFIPADELSKVTHMDDWKKRERTLGQMARQTRTVVKGGSRVVKVKLSIPIDQYAGLQRFEGDTDAQKILAILRMANRRVDQVARMTADEREKAQAPVEGTNEA